MEADEHFGLDMKRWQETIRTINRPTSVSIGSNDELFDARQYPATFARLNPRIALRWCLGSITWEWFSTTQPFPKRSVRRARC
ncbi:MAG: hypothetical protein WDN76_07440 [Alphaproteobacteria bacterium]